MAENISGDGQTSVIHWRGGLGSIFIYGTFGGGTIKLQYSPDDETTWVDVKDRNGTAISATAADHFEFELPEGHLRADTSGATTPDANVQIRRIRNFESSSEQL